MRARGRKTPRIREVSLPLPCAGAFPKGCGQLVGTCREGAGDNALNVTLLSSVSPAGPPSG